MPHTYQGMGTLTNDWPRRVGVKIMNREMN